MDIRKAFDSVNHAKLFEALAKHGLDEGYIILIRLLYANQTASINGSCLFDIKSGVKQGDPLSTILFNTILDIVFERWKMKLLDHGIFIGYRIERFTNTLYADDILLYIRSLQELREMTELLIPELNAVELY